MSYYNGITILKDTVIPLTVIIIVILVVIVCVIVRSRKKRNLSSVGALSTGTDVVHNNAATIAAAKKERNINKGTYDNPTYGLKGIDNETFRAPQDYEMLDNNVYDEVVH